MDFFISYQIYNGFIKTVKIVKLLFGYITNKFQDSLLKVHCGDKSSNVQHLPQGLIPLDLMINLGIISGTHHQYHFPQWVILVIVQLLWRGNRMTERMWKLIILMVQMTRNGVRKILHGLKSWRFVVFSFFLNLFYVWICGGKWQWFDDFAIRLITRKCLAITHSVPTKGRWLMQQWVEMTFLSSCQPEVERASKKWKYML